MTFEMKLNGQQVQATDGETILTVAARTGVNIPTLCHDDRLDPMGSCRMCLVEIEGQRRLEPACAFKVRAGMDVQSESDRITRHRKMLLSMYMADHALDEKGLPKQRGVGNELRTHVETYGSGPALEPINAQRESREDANPYIQFDPEACILCNRCVRYCDEVEAVSAITLAHRGSKTTIATANQVGLLDSSCEMCGGCIATCPTGAMTEKPSIASSIADETITRSTCNFCGVGCQLNLHVTDDKVVRVTSPEPGETVNDGNLCIKGRFAYEFIHSEERLTQPLIRGEDGKLHPTDWDTAIRKTAEGLLGVKKRHGADALGFISSSRCTGEENYLMQKLSRAAFVTNNIHQCAAT
jgi:predicted molibdopterin-dependent oxidoreductase YjgC